MRTRLLTWLCIIFLPVMAVGQEEQPVPATTVSISPYSALIGDPVSLEIRVLAPLAREITAPEVEQGLGQLMVRSAESRQLRTIIGGLLLVHRIEATPFTVGELVIPSLEYEIIYPDGSSDRVVSPPVLLSIPSVSGEAEGPETVAGMTDILRPEEMKEKGGWPWWAWLLSALIVLIPAAIWLWRRRTPSSVKDLLRRTPAEQTLEDLYQLEKERLLEQEEYDPFFTRLSRILRRYLGLRYHIYALEMTSSELKEIMNSRWSLGEFDVQEFDELLRRTDLAKYARHSPGIEQGYNSLETGRQIVYSTRNDRPTVRREEE